MQLGPKTLLFLMLLVGLIVGSYFMLFKTLNQKERQLVEETRAKREMLEKVERSTASGQNLSQEIEKLRKAIAFFESKLPEEKEMDKVLREVWQQAEKNGLTVKSVRNLAVVSSQSYSEQPIRMLIVGPFPGFHKFLYSVEQMPRITRIGDMQLEGDDKGQGIITADLVLTIYFERSVPKQST